MVEEIKLSELTRDCITNHDVMCRGVHCVYRETINGFTGRSSTKNYIVLNAEVDVRFKTITELKKHIKRASNV